MTRSLDEVGKLEIVNKPAAQTVGQIYAAMANILREFPVVTKSHRNTGGGGYAYRGIDDVYEAAHDLLAKHSVTPLPTIRTMDFEEVGATKAGAKQFRCTVRGTLRFIHADGSFVETGFAGEGIDTGDKGGMKAISNAIKYVYWNTFCVPTAEKKDSEAYPEPDLGGPAKNDADEDEDVDFEPKRGRK